MFGGKGAELRRVTHFDSLTSYTLRVSLSFNIYDILQVALFEIGCCFGFAS